MNCILKVTTGAPRFRALQLDATSSTLGTETVQAAGHCPSCSGGEKHRATDSGHD